MTRIFRGTIAFDFDIEELEDFFERPFTDEMAVEYVRDTMYEDFINIMKVGDFDDYLKVEKVD